MNLPYGHDEHVDCLGPSANVPERDKRAEANSTHNKQSTGSAIVTSRFARVELRGAIEARLAAQLAQLILEESCLKARLIARQRGKPFAHQVGRDRRWSGPAPSWIDRPGKDHSRSVPALAGTSSTGSRCSQWSRCSARSAQARKDCTASPPSRRSCSQLGRDRRTTDHSALGSVQAASRSLAHC